MAMDNNLKTEIVLKARKHTYDFIIETLGSDEFVDKLHEAFWKKADDLGNWTTEERWVADNTMFKVLVGIISDAQSRR